MGSISLELLFCKNKQNKIKFKDKPYGIEFWKIKRYIWHEYTNSMKIVVYVIF